MERRMWLLAGVGVVVGVVIVTLYLVGNASGDRSHDWGIDEAEWRDMRAGGWKQALDPLETVPVEPHAAAEEVALRIADHYCGERDAERVELHNTDHDYVKFIPACIEIDLPGDRLETHSARIEVQVGGPPLLTVPGLGTQCIVNAGRQYKGQPYCVELLRGIKTGGS